MTNHSIVSASRGTHLKIAFIAVVASFVFVGLMSASSSNNTASTGTAYASGPAIKATTIKALATSDTYAVR
jgi:hypothetical protein